MSDRAVAWAHSAIAAVYTLVGASLSVGGFTAAEFGLMVVVGAIAALSVVLADWINAGVRRDDE
jgi:hypothetical protein